MAEPLTFTAAAIVAAHFVGEHGLAHTVGGEIYHFYRRFVQRWRVSSTDPKTGLPLNRWAKSRTS